MTSQNEANEAHIILRKSDNSGKPQRCRLSLERLNRLLEELDQLISGIDFDKARNSLFIENISLPILDHVKPSKVLPAPSPTEGPETQLLFQSFPKISSSISTKMDPDRCDSRATLVVSRHDHSSEDSSTETRSFYESLNGTPMVFKRADMEPDVRIRIFEKEFHLHSFVLRIHSRHFREMFDLTSVVFNGSDNGTVSGTFRYDYESVLEPMGGWSLMPAIMVCAF